MFKAHRLLYHSTLGSGTVRSSASCHAQEREFFIDPLLVRIHFIIVMIRWTSLAPWECEFPFPGSLTSTFLMAGRTGPDGAGA